MNELFDRHVEEHVTNDRIEDKHGFSFEAPHWSASFGLIDFPLKDDIKITHR